MKCPKCGKEVPDSAKVCGYCGYRLKAKAPPPAPMQQKEPEPSSAKESPPVETDRAGSEPILQAPAASPARPMESIPHQTPIQKRKRISGWAGMLLGLLTIGAIVAVLVITGVLEFGGRSDNSNIAKAATPRPSSSATAAGTDASIAATPRPSSSATPTVTDGSTSDSGWTVIVDEDFAEEAEGEYILAYDTGGFINRAIGEAKGNFRLEFDACFRDHQAALPGWGITAASSQLDDGNLKIIDASFHIGKNLFSVNVWTEEGSEFLAMNALTNVIDQDIGAVSHIEMSAEGGVIRLIVNDQLRAATSWPTQDTNHSFDWGVFNETEVGFDNLRIEENQSMIGSFAEPSQPAKISLYAMEENAPADTPVVLTTGWIADTEAQVEGFLDSMFIEVSLDGEYLPMAYEMWGEVEPYKDDDDDGDMDYISYWAYPVGILSPGKHLVETAGSLTSEIYDGWDTREPGALWDWELILAIGD